MTATANFSPVSLSYTAALRGVKPRRPGMDFAYGLINCLAPDRLIALAASNPEGQFYGVMSNADACEKSNEDARVRQVSNVKFISAAAELPSLDYLCCDASEHDLTASERDAAFDLSARALKPGGLFAFSYRTGVDATSNLRFLVREFAPEMNAKQANEFLVELKKLGTLYFKEHRELAAKLDKAIAQAMPDEFFAGFEQGEAKSSTFDTIVALRPRGFAYAGDCRIDANYVELSVPVEAQSIVVACRENPLYETIKDFALNRTVRHDIWARQPAVMSSQPGELFGIFAYGIPMSRDEVPAELAVQGKTISFESPINKMLIDLMTLMPVGIGDVMAFPAGKDFAVTEILENIQVLIACGIARPMRGNRLLTSTAVYSIAQPRFFGTFNQYHDKTAITEKAYPFASPVLGDVITLPARDVLVMQALDRAGLANSVESLLTELQRLAANPASAARIMDAVEPTEQVARNMIEDAVNKSIVHWYAYGLLEAA